MSGRRQVILAFGVLTIVFAGLLYRAEHRTDQTNARITRVASPCLLYGSKSELCKRSFETAVLTITHPEACAILRKAGLVISNCKHARLRQELERRIRRSKQAPNDSAGSEVEAAPTHSASGEAKPGGVTETHEGTSAGAPGGTKSPPKSQTPHHQAGAEHPATDTPADTETVETAPPPQPGNSGATPAAENSNGVKACVDLAVSACVNSELEVPLHLP